MPRNEWPKRISRDRAIPALELAGLVLDQEQDLEPHVGEGDNFETVTLDAEAWGRLVERARQAVGGLLHVDARTLPAREEPPDYAEAFEAFLDKPADESTKVVGRALNEEQRLLLRRTLEEAFRAGWNAGRQRTVAERAR